MAYAENEQKKADLINDKIETFKQHSISDNLAEGINWMENNDKEDNPFNMPGMTEK